jgi:nucleoside-diphosphate-sugar epimerase
MVALEDLVPLLLRLVLETPTGVHTWIVSDGHSHSAGQIHDLMRAALGKKPSRSWLPIGAWRLGCGLRDILSGSALGSTFEKVFGVELYSSAALQSALDWRPTVALADTVKDIMAPPSQRGEEARC